MSYCSAICGVLYAIMPKLSKQRQPDLHAAGGRCWFLSRNFHKEGKTMKKLKNILANCCAAIVAIAFVPVATAQEQPNLLGAKSIMCDFDKGAAVEFDGGDAKVSFANFGKGGAVTYSSINLEEREAIISGVSGKNAVAILPTVMGLTFVEGTAFGNIIFTTIFLIPHDDGSFPAVTSRHVAGLAGPPIPSQYYGVCTVAN